MSKIIGAIISPLALVLIGFSSLILPGEMQNASPLVPALQSNWLMMHVSMMMVSYANFNFWFIIMDSIFSFITRKRCGFKCNLFF